jgi:hypothetical protein
LFDVPRFYSVYSLLSANLKSGVSENTLIRIRSKVDILLETTDYTFAVLDDNSEFSHHCSGNQLGGLETSALSDYIKEIRKKVEKKEMVEFEGKKGEFSINFKEVDDLRKIGYSEAGIPKDKSGKPYSLVQELPFQAIIYKDELRNVFKAFIIYMGRYNVENLTHPLAFWTEDKDLVKAYYSILETFIQEQNGLVLIGNPRKREDEEVPELRKRLEDLERNVRKRDAREILKLRNRLADLIRKARKRDAREILELRKRLEDLERKARKRDAREILELRNRLEDLERNPPHRDDKEILELRERLADLEINPPHRDDKEILELRERLADLQRNTHKMDEKELVFKGDNGELNKNNAAEIVRIYEKSEKFFTKIVLLDKDYKIISLSPIDAFQKMADKMVQQAKKLVEEHNSSSQESPPKGLPSGNWIRLVIDVEQGAYFIGNIVTEDEYEKVYVVAYTDKQYLVNACSVRFGFLIDDLRKYALGLPPHAIYGKEEK